MICIRSQNNILRISRFDMRHCHAVGPEFAECPDKPTRKRPRPADFEDIGESPNPALENVEENFRSRPRPALNRDEKLDILTPHLNQLADYMASQDDARFYRNLDAVRSIYEGRSSQRMMRELVFPPPPPPNVDFLGGRIDEVSP